VQGQLAAAFEVLPDEEEVLDDDGVELDEEDDSEDELVDDELSDDELLPDAARLSVR